MAFDMFPNRIAIASKGLWILFGKNVDPLLYVLDLRKCFAFQSLVDFSDRSVDLFMFEDNLRSQAKMEWVARHHQLRCAVIIDRYDPISGNDDLPRDADFGAKIQFHQIVPGAIQTWRFGCRKYYRGRVSVNEFRYNLISLIWARVVFAQNESIAGGRPAVQWVFLAKLTELFPWKWDRRFHFQCDQWDIHHLWRHLGRVRFSIKAFNMLSIFQWSTHRRGSLLHI